LGIGRNFCGLLAQTALSVGAAFLIARVCRDFAQRVLCRGHFAVQQRMRDVRLSFDGCRKPN
jgi:hypothetical protein